MMYQYKPGFAPAGMCYDPVTYAVLAVGALSAGVSVYEGNQQEKAIKNAQNDAAAAQAKSLEEAKAAVAGAGDQAQAQIDAKRRAIAASNTVFTNPLGIGGQAAVNKKTLLGA
jgi:uncharacterized protein HemX